MRWSFKILTVAGIGIYLHVTFLMLIAYLAFGAFAEGGAEAALMVVALVLSLFACVVLHELGHALTARRFGVGTRDITLLPIGGVARLERIPREPIQELLIAVAGPLVNVVIAIVLSGLMLALGLSPFEGPLSLEAQEENDLVTITAGAGPYLKTLLAVNVFMVLFNLVPAFPMDGGRILRSLLAMRLSHHRATRIAAAAGQLFAIAFGIIGMLNGHFILILIAVFVFLGAAGEASAARMYHTFHGLPVAMGMITELKTLTRESTLAEAVDLLLRGSQVDFPVVDEGRVAGLLTRQQLVLSLRERGAGTAVRDVPLQEVTPVEADLPLERAYEEMSIKGVRSLPVVKDGKLVGLMTLDNLTELVLVRQALDRL
jgi:Zn-dependent protease/CBS domain-containing protein